MLCPELSLSLSLLFSFRVFTCIPRIEVCLVTLFVLAVFCSAGALPPRLQPRERDDRLVGGRSSGNRLWYGDSNGGCPPRERRPHTRPYAVRQVQVRDPLGGSVIGRFLG